VRAPPQKLPGNSMAPSTLSLPNVLDIGLVIGREKAAVPNFVTHWPQSDTVPGFSFKGQTLVSPKGTHSSATKTGQLCIVEHRCHTCGTLVGEPRKPWEQEVWTR
jgi:hypothetical protein